MVFGVEPSAALQAAAERVHHHVVVPAPVAVTRRALVAPHVAALAVEHRLAALHESADVVPRRAGIRHLAVLLDGALPLVAWPVGVPRVDVSDHVVVVARRIVLHEARRVERLRLRVGVRHAATHPGRVALRAVAAPVLSVGEEPPRLVEEHPREHGGVVEVALDHVLEARPVLGEHSLARGPPRARHVGHDQQAETVRPVQLARHLHLDVDAVAGERQVLGDEDLVLHELVGRERVEAVRVVALVKGQLQVDRLAVERHVRMVRAGKLADTDLAHAEVRGHRVLAPFTLQRRAHLVEVGVREVPQLDVAERDLDLDRLLSGRKRRERRSRAVVSLEGQLELERLPRRLAQRDRGVNRAVLDIRGEMHRLEVLPSARLEVDGLPHAARVAVRLLAVEPPAAAGGHVALVPRAERELLRLAPLHQLGQLELERRVAAGVRAELLPVEPAGRVVVGRADDEEHALALPLGRNGDVAPIPADVGLVLDARELAAPRKRHQYALRETVVIGGEPLVLQSGVLRVERELPAAVQVDPLGAFPVGARMLRKRNFLRGERKSAACGKRDNPS